MDPGTVRRDDPQEVFRIEPGISDDGEKTVGRLVLSGLWIVEEERIAIRAQLVEGCLNFEPMERVTHVGVSSHLSLLPAEERGGVATRTWNVETSRGNSYSGVSVARGSAVALAHEDPDRVLRARWSEVTGEKSNGRRRRSYRVVVEEDAWMCP